MYKEVAKLILYRDLGERTAFYGSWPVFSRIMKRTSAAPRS